MTIAATMPASTAAASAASTGASSTGSTGTLSFTQNFNTFLTLLTTQLQNQDPLSPMDTNTFTQQLVSFSEVEQQINTNNNLQSLIQLQTANEGISALPLVGQTIDYSSPTAPLQDGQASFTYSLPSAAANSALVVEDSNGNVVYTQPGQTASGTHNFTWNGQTNGGQQMPDGGDYTLQVVANDANNQPITATIQSLGTVTGVSVTNGTANFSLAGGLSIPISQLVSVNPSQSGSTSSGTTASTTH
jgi:flagellar basal-body rod modification protein FlgD